MPREMENDNKENMKLEPKISTPMEIIPEVNDNPRAIDMFIGKVENDDSEENDRPKTRNFDVEIPKPESSKAMRSRSKKNTIKNRNMLYLQKLQEKNDHKKNSEAERLRIMKEKREKLRAVVLKKCKEIGHIKEPESITSQDTESGKIKKGAFIIKTKTKTSSRGRRSLNTTNVGKFKKSITLKNEKSKTAKSLKSTEKIVRKFQKPPRRLAPLVNSNSAAKNLKETEPRRKNINRKNLTEAPLSLAPNKNNIIEEKNFKASKSIAPQPKSSKSKTSKLRSFAYITDVKEWLKKNRLPVKAKVYIVGNGYNCIKKALKDRGWIANPDYFSTCFHLKFTLRGSHIEYGSLKPYQIVNHFEKVSCLTTKIGLCRTMNNVNFYVDIDSDSFFPKCFDCNEDMEFDSFVVYYKLTRAECILKTFLELAIEGKRDDKEYKNLLESDMVDVALKVTKRRLMDLGELVRTKKNWTEVTEEEWEILSKGDVTEDQIKKLLYSQNVKRYLKMENKKGKKNKKKKKKSKKKKKKSKEKKEDENKEEENEDEDDEDQEEDQEKLTPQEKEIKSVVKKLETKFPQTKMNGKNNIWIVKPAGLSRGRGIKLFSSYHEIVHHIKTRNFSWIIQKYMENPLVFKKKKIDIRQWILVTDWNPLTVWFYQECYIRISTAEYNLDNLKDRYVHLTNNSVNKKAANFVQEDGFMSQDEMIQWLDEEYGEGSFKKIQRQMKRQVKWSLMAAQEQVDNRKGSSEILGYDFCIDEDLKVWLIEVNASPDFTFSSSVTEALVRKASEDYVKVMVDYGMSKKKNKKDIDTGLFKKIYKSKTHKKCKEAIGMKFEVVGEKINVDKCKKLFKKEDKDFKQNRGLFDEELNEYLPDSEVSGDDDENDESDQDEKEAELSEDDEDQRKDEKKIEDDDEF